MVHLSSTPSRQTPIKPPNNKTPLYLGLGALVVVVGMLALVTKQDPKSAAVTHTLPVAQTDTGLQYGFQGGGGVGPTLCLESGLGEIMLSHNKKFEAIAPMRGELKQIQTKKGCTPVYYFSSPLSQYAIKISGDGLTAGQYEKGDVMGKDTQFNIALMIGTRPEGSSEVLYEVEVPDVSPGEVPALLHLVFPTIQAPQQES